MTVATYFPVDHQQKKVIKLPIANVDTAGGLAALLNPFGVDVLITRCIVHTTTAATGACTLDAGVAANATTADDELIDGLDVNAAAGIFDNLIDPGTNGEPVALWEDDQYFTASAKTGASAGLVGNIYLEIQRI